MSDSSSEMFYDPWYDQTECNLGNNLLKNFPFCKREEESDKSVDDESLKTEEDKVSSELVDVLKK